MTSSSTANGSPLANQSAAENSVKSIAPVVASTQGESSKPSLVKGPTSAYIGVNKARGKDHVYTSFAYVKTRGRSVYLGRYADEEEAARLHDIVTLKCSGARAKLNFPASHYQDIMRMMRDMDDEEVLAHVRRSGSRFARSDSNYRGVTRYSQTGGWFSGYHSLVHQDQIPLFRYSQTVMHLLSAHPNSQAHNAFDSSAQHMFSHCSSSPFKPYVKN
nr:AP2-like ethylene-responsive transcription factor AIL1 [Coffea arabica]